MGVFWDFHTVQECNPRGGKEYRLWLQICFFLFLNHACEDGARSLMVAVVWWRLLRVGDGGFLLLRTHA